VGRRLIRPLAAVALPALIAVGAAGARPALDRSTADRPDDISGPQVHAMYVVPADGADRALDTNGTIAASVANWESWLRGQTGGHGLRLDTAGGNVDVTFFRLTKTDAEVTAMGAFVRDEIERELRAAGLVATGKLYAVYYDGNSTYACGGGAWPPTLPGVVAAVYMPPTFWNTSGTPCYVPSRSLAGMQLMDYAIVHELLHTLGFVPSCAPHFTRAGHVSDSPTDLLYAGDQPWNPSVLDVGHDDYFDAHVAGCPDLVDSPYLEGNGPFAITVTRSGRGTVTSTPAGIRCPGTCTASFDRGATVTLGAAPAAGSRFAGWSGDCTGTARTCTLAISADHSAAAGFVLLPRCKKGRKSTPRFPCRP
jgi:Divergent InlB B-repeat domain